MTPQETDPDLPLCVQEPPVEVWIDSDLLQGQGTEWGSVQETFEGGQPLSSLPPPQFGQTTGREHSAAHQLKIGLKVC